MKGILSVTFSIFLLFFLFGAKNAHGQNSGQEVLKELDDFQKSLSNWMKNLDTLTAQFTTLQKNVGESLTPLKEFDKSVKGIEEKLNTIVSRVAVVEKSSSIAEVKGMLDSFNKTFDVLKKLLSDLSKRVEDQEVKAAVLEKRYHESQRPLEPIKKAIDDLTKLVTDKLGEQEKRIASVEDSFKTRVASLDTTLKSIEGQSKVLAELETRTKKLEKAGIAIAPGAVTTEAPPPPQTQVSVGTETVQPEKGTETVEVEKERIPTLEEEGFKEIGDNFYLRNVNLFPFGSSSQIKGEIKNLSDRDRSIATFTIKIYNNLDMLLFSQDFSIKTFKLGEIRPFNEIISGYAPLDIAKYEIIPKRRY